MKIIFLTLIVFISTLLIMFNPVELFADKKIEINLGQIIHVDDLELNFYDIDDSRCPSDAECIWAGQVTIMIHLQNQTHKISDSFTPGYTSSSMTPHKITLIDVDPYPVSTVKPNYVATFIISNLNERSLCEENMVLENGFCVVIDPTPEDFRGSDPNFRIDDSIFNMQSLQTGETFTVFGTITSIIVDGLGAILIVFFIILYAIKKRLEKKHVE